MGQKEGLLIEEGGATWRIEWQISARVYAKRGECAKN